MSISIREFREKELGLTQTEFAARLGLKSKASVSEIEKTNSCSVSLALEIERLTDGRIPAATLSADVALVEQARAA